MITEEMQPVLKSVSAITKNSFGLDRKVVNACMNWQPNVKTKNTRSTFMIATDPHPRSSSFVPGEFTRDHPRIMAATSPFFLHLIVKRGAFILKDFEKC
jgi:hypothetical protein